jgi:hypothetical protein
MFEGKKFSYDSSL